MKRTPLFVFPLVLVLLLVLPACKEETTPVAVVEPTLDELVIENCNIVVEAAKTYEAQNGWYPNGVSDLLPFLPNGEWLVNPYTTSIGEPVNGLAANKGTTAYQQVTDSNSNTVGCNITGYGEIALIYLISLDQRNP